jgi:hypothetical protein
VFPLSFQLTSKTPRPLLILGFRAGALRHPAGDFLSDRFIVNHRGIEANPEKIKAIMRMEAPRSQKKVQRLTGCMAALSRFISRLGEKGLPFYKLLKKVDKFQWTTEAQEALDALKKFLTTPLGLKPPRRAFPD